jgi:hypothetical protein
LKRFSYSDDPAGFLSSAAPIELEACVRRQREDYGIARRANAILLLDEGESCALIAKFLYLEDDTIRGWHKPTCNMVGMRLPTTAGKAVSPL